MGRCGSGSRSLDGIHCKIHNWCCIYIFGNCLFIYIIVYLFFSKKKKYFTAWVLFVWMSNTEYYVPFTHWPGGLHFGGPVRKVHFVPILEDKYICIHIEHLHTQKSHWCQLFKLECDMDRLLSGLNLVPDLPVTWPATLHSSFCFGTSMLLTDLVLYSDIASMLLVV